MDVGDSEDASSNRVHNGVRTRGAYSMTAANTTNVQGVNIGGSGRTQIGPTFIQNIANENDPQSRMNKVLHSLSSDYEKHRESIETRVPGTCEWFVENEQYRTWRDGKTSSLLLVSADPGCGKSVLQRWLIDESRKKDHPSESKTCFFFFREGLEDRTQGGDALRAILHQLLRGASSRLIEHVLSDFESHGEKIRDKIEELWRILSKIQQLGEVDEIVCFIDALDECEKQTRDRLLRIITRFYSSIESANSTSTRIKFLLTTRPYEHIMELFHISLQATQIIHFDGTEHLQEVGHDIDLVIDAKVPYLGISLSPDLQEHLKNLLKSIPHRTYLWLYLILDVIRNGLRKKKTIKHVDEILRGLPQTIADAYSAILSRCQEEEAARTLLQIVVAARRPLTVRELNIAYELATSGDEVQAHNDLDCEDDDVFKSTIRRICGLFLTIHDSKVFLFHQTARAYLLHESKLCCNSWHHFTENEAHLTLSAVCLHYLSFSVFKEPPWEIRFLPHRREFAESQEERRAEKAFEYFIQTNPLLHYSALNWMDHFGYYEPAHSQQSVSAATKLCSVNTGLCQLWLSVWKREENELEIENNLVLASTLGLSLVVKRLLEQDITANTYADFYGKALLVASAGGYEKVVELLLARGADLNAQGGYSGNALQAASWRGHEKVVELLLAQGADLNAQGGYYGNALQAASYWGYEKVVELLLARGADVNAQGGKYGNALQAALARGHEKVVEMLLVRGASR